MPTPPSDGRITSRFGPRVPPTPTSSNFHGGEDRIGRGNVSPVDGQVIYTGYAGTWGNTVVVRGYDGVHWLIAHFKRIDVRMNQSVSEGFWLGEIGTTGASTGVHSHTERRINASYSTPLGGVRVDPNPFYTAGKPTVVPSAPTLEIEMTWEQFRDALQRALKFEARDGKDGKVGSTIWELLAKAFRVSDPSNDKDPDGGWFPFRNAMSRWLRYHSRVDGPDGKGRTIHEALDAIEAAVRSGGAPAITVKLDRAVLQEALVQPGVVQAFATAFADEQHRRMEK